MAELIASGDTLNIGRIAINNWYSGSSSIWSATTSNTLLNINSTTTAAAGAAWGLALGIGNNITSGSYSVALNGSGNSLSNNFSLVGNGRNNTSSNSYALVVNGRSNTASRSTSTVLNGRSNTASGTGSLIAGGNGNNSSSYYSTVINGQLNTSSSLYSIVLNGQSNTASGFYSIVGNGFANNIENGGNTYYTTILNGTSNRIKNTVNAQHSVILGGLSNIIKAKRGLAFGTSNYIQHDYTIAIGDSVNTNTMGAISKQMIFANAGNATVRIDYGNGKIYTDAGASFTPADYAEYFEWEDGNSTGELRYGLSVSLGEDGKIKIGNDNIIGIVSSSPGIIGDAAELGWKNKYKLNEWGQVMTEVLNRYDIIRPDENGKNKSISIWVDSLGNQYSKEPQNENQKQSFLISNKFEFSEDEEISKRESVVNLLSEEFNSDELYIPRSQRKEFSPIGLLGKLRVKTAEKIISKYIDFNSNGLAINGTKYNVIESIKEYDGNYGIVKIFFK